MDIFVIFERLIALIQEEPHLGVDPHSEDEWYVQAVNRTLSDLARFSESQLLPDALPSASHVQLVELQARICDAGAHMHPIYLDKMHYETLARDLQVLVDRERSENE